MKKLTNAGCIEGPGMTSQLGLNFQASQAVHGADDNKIPQFKSQVNYLSFCGPQVDTLIY